jgi:DNA-binding GntR family transcriptional regulator
VLEPSFRRPLRGLRTVLSDETYLRVRHMLLNHEIAPGRRINIDALARELNVSQTPIREALARLESEGLVVKEPLRGYRASALLTVAQIRDLFQFRGIIEPWAAGKAACSITDDGRARLAAELEAGLNAEHFDPENAYAAMSEHDVRFHTLIAELSGSEFVHEAYVRTHCHLHLFRLYTVLETRMSEAREGAEVVGELFKLYYQPESGFLAFKEHQGIAGAILAGDEDGARRLMQEHIENSLRRITPSMALLEAGR